MTTDRTTDRKQFTNRTRTACLAVTMAAALFLYIPGLHAQASNLSDASQTDDTEAVHTVVLEDEEIADAIRAQMAADHAVNAGQIHVECHEGIIELTGTVTRILDKERALQIAERIKGVRAVSNRINVKPPVVLTDMAIRQNVRGALYGDPATDSYEVEVSASNQVVTLEGSVDSHQEKILCGYVAKSAVGVKDVINALEVEYRDARPDLVIEKEVRNALKWNIMVDDGLIEVEANNGTVALSGAVGSAAERSQAFALAWIAGVNQVDISDLDVHWWAENEKLRKFKDVDVTDAEIRSAVISAAAYDPRVYSYNIDPVVIDGWVTLEGSVDNLRAKSAAESIAANTLGVQGVTNALNVTTDKGLEDAALKMNIEKGLANNSTTGPYRLQVSVEEGIVTLTGSVNTQGEKSEAAWVAAGQRGVAGIVNEIRVDSPTAYYRKGFYPYYSTQFPAFTYPVPAYSIGMHGSLPNDEDIRRAIEHQLRWSPFVDAEQVDVDVEDGKVTLNGTVDSRREYSAAIENAWEGGAWAVTSKLTIDNH